MRLREDRLERADGSPGLYSVVEKSPAAVVVALDGEHIWLVEQWRHPVGARFWDLPQGALDGGPEVAPEEVARTELAEETGLRAGRLEHLGRLFFAYGLSAQPFDVFLATDLVQGEVAPEDTEGDLRCARVAVAQFEAMLRDGTIKDAATHAAWGLVRLRGLAP